MPGWSATPAQPLTAPQPARASAEMPGRHHTRGEAGLGKRPTRLPSALQESYSINHGAFADLIPL